MVIFIRQQVVNKLNKTLNTDKLLFIWLLVHCCYCCHNHVWIKYVTPNHACTPCLKKRPTFGFDTRERILIFFGRNATDKVAGQKTLYYVISNNVRFCSNWQNGKHENCIFTRSISALPELNQSLLDFFNFLDSRTHTLLYDSLNFVSNAFSLDFFWGGGMVQERGSQERYNSWNVLHAQSTSALSSGFPLSQGNAEALDRWGGKTKHSLVSYFLNSTSAKNYRNRIVCIKTIASLKWDVLTHSVYVCVSCVCVCVFLFFIGCIYCEINYIYMYQPWPISKSVRRTFCGCNYGRPME